MIPDKIILAPNLKLTHYKNKPKTTYYNEIRVKRYFQRCSTSILAPHSLVNDMQLHGKRIKALLRSGIKPHRKYPSRRSSPTTTSVKMLFQLEAPRSSIWKAEREGRSPRRPSPSHNPSDYSNHLFRPSWGNVSWSASRRELCEYLQ